MMFLQTVELLGESIYLSILFLIQRFKLINSLSIGFDELLVLNSLICGLVQVLMVIANNNSANKQ